MTGFKRTEKGKYERRNAIVHRRFSMSEFTHKQLVRRMAKSIKLRHVHYAYMPDDALRPVKTGMTLKEALAALRQAGQKDFGPQGCLVAWLSDFSVLQVGILIARDGCRLHGTQRICRHTDTHKTTYKW